MYTYDLFTHIKSKLDEKGIKNLKNDFSYQYSINKDQMSESLITNEYKQIKLRLDIKVSKFGYNGYEDLYITTIYKNSNFVYHVDWKFSRWDLNTTSSSYGFQTQTKTENSDVVLGIIESYFKKIKELLDVKKQFDKANKQKDN